MGRPSWTDVWCGLDIGNSEDAELGRLVGSEAVVIAGMEDKGNH